MDDQPSFAELEQHLYWKTHEVAEIIYSFLRGFYLVYFAFCAYKTLLKDKASSSYYFWFRLNREWLFMNYEPEEMFINDLI